MINESNFMDDLLKEAEENDQRLKGVQIDLLVLQIIELQKQIEKNFNQADQEVEIIKNWSLERNSILQEKVMFIEKKLESYMREQAEIGIKAEDLPHAILKIRKLPDKAEVVNLEEFLSNANGDLVTVVPESVKPNLNAVKAFIKRTGGKLPPGCRIVEGKEEFSYKIKNKEIDNGRAKEVGVGDQQADEYKDVI
jgi:uncharacterized protein YllA (UPF0747 family)